MPYPGPGTYPGGSTYPGEGSGVGGVGYSWFIVELVTERLPRDHTQPSDGEIDSYVNNGTLLADDRSNGYIIDTSKNGTLDPYTVIGTIVDAVRAGTLVPYTHRSGSVEEYERDGYISGQGIHTGQVVDATRSGLVKDEARSGVPKNFRSIEGLVKSYVNGGNVMVSQRNGYVPITIASGAVRASSISSGIVQDNNRRSGVVVDFEHGGIEE